MEKIYDLDNLPNPEDLAGENLYEFVGLYIQVYAKYVKASRAITEHITGDLDLNRQLHKIAEFTEVPLIRWLEQADEFLPEWFDSKLLNYPDTPAGRTLVASADAPAESGAGEYKLVTKAEIMHELALLKEDMLKTQNANDLLIETLQARAEKAEAAYHASEQQFVTLAQVLGVPYELNTQQDLVAMVKARLQAADEVAKVVQTMLDLIVSWTYTDSDDYSRISDDLGQVLDACIPLKVALTFYRKNQS